MVEIFLLAYWCCLYLILKRFVSFSLMTDLNSLCNTFDWLAGCSLDTGGSTWRKDQTTAFDDSALYEQYGAMTEIQLQTDSDGFLVRWVREREVSKLQQHKLHSCFHLSSPPTLKLTVEEQVILLSVVLTVRTEKMNVLLLKPLEFWCLSACLFCDVWLALLLQNQCELRRGVHCEPRRKQPRPRDEQVDTFQWRNCGASGGAIRTALYHPMWVSVFSRAFVSNSSFSLWLAQEKAEFRTQHRNHVPRSSSFHRWCDQEFQVDHQCRSRTEHSWSTGQHFGPIYLVERTELSLHEW